MNEKKFVKKVAISICLVMVIIISIIVVCDPFFHYHKPIESLSYKMEEATQRYMNDGIARNFEYDAIITGTSMAENFKSSQLDQLFDVQSIKVPFSGGSFKVVDEFIQNALKYNPQTKLVIRSLDLQYIARDKDFKHEWYPDPQYLYDDNIFNDVNYVLNKDILLKWNMIYCVLSSIAGENTTFDEYSNWNNWYTYGAVNMIERYKRPEISEERKVADYETVKENIEQNILAAAKNNPQVEFYYFITPYSVVGFDEIERKYGIEEYLKEVEYAVSLLIDEENITIFSYLNEYEIVTNLDIYRDETHYNESINEYILETMSKGENIITSENYDEHFAEIIDFYKNYDYEQIFDKYYDVKEEK